MAEPQRWNRYAYVTNNPMRFTDPTGSDRYNEPGFTKPLIEADWNNATPEVKLAFSIQGTLVSLALGEGYASLVGGLRAASRLARSIDNPATFTGAKPEQLRQAIPESWGPGSPSRRGGGMRWGNPMKRGDGVRIMPGTAGARDPMHGGPYAVFTRNGQEIRVPLAGNPILQDQNIFKQVIDVVKSILK